LSPIIAHIKTFALALLGAVRALYFKARQSPLEAEAILVGIILMAAAIQEPGGAPRRTDGRIVISGEAVEPNALEETFSAFGYLLDDVRTGDTLVPRLIVSSMPEGLKDIRVIDRRKRLFFRLVLPLILTTNESIESDRARLLAIGQSVDENSNEEVDISPENIIWINDLAARYNIDPLEDDLTIKDLVGVLAVRVAPVPTSLALAQAVEESAWGTSRFAREGNALFGQWVWNKDAGIVPTDQREGQAYAVRAFATPLDSVRAYAKNLNTHWAYTSFREQRAEMLNTTGDTDGWTLAQSLTRYSERGEAYVESLHTIMRVNRLRSLDDAELATPEDMKQMASTS
jgi:Bax protein